MKKGSPIIKADNIDRSLVPETRLTPWWHSYGPQGHRILLKREDDGRFGITAGKLRKYASLLPWLLRQGIHTVVLVGGANSNHLLSAAILLREYGMAPVPFVKQSPSRGTNQFLLSLLVPSGQWKTIPSAEWPRVDSLAGEFVAQLRSEGIPAIALPEGACTKEALAGAMTLADDIRRNEAEIGEAFTDVFIDAGSGLSAAALLMRMHELQMEARVHVTLMADPEPVFLEKLRTYCEWYEEAYQRTLPDLRGRLVLHRPVFGRSYGSVNAAVTDTIRRYARLGIFTDPIYSAKHLATVEHHLGKTSRVASPGLVIHSGGAQALPGYAHLLER